MVERFFSKLKPVMQTITITPATIFDKEFAIITRSNNTELGHKYINDYKKNPDILVNSAFHLLENKTMNDKNFSPTTYTIIDGGHRITALCECARENNCTYIIHAYIYDWGDFNYDLEKVIDFYQLIGKSRKQSQINILEANSFRSNWLKFFKTTNVNISFEQLTKSLSWTNVINAFLNANRILQYRKVGKVHGYDPEELKAEFIDGNQKDMKQMYAFLCWWIPIAEMVKIKHGIGTLYSLPFLTAGFLIWHENLVTEKDGEKIAEFQRFLKLRQYAHAGQFPEFLDFLLFAVNYRNSKRRLAVFGSQGQEP